MCDKNISIATCVCEEGGFCGGILSRGLLSSYCVKCILFHISSRVYRQAHHLLGVGSGGGEVGGGSWRVGVGGQCKMEQIHVSCFL